MDGVFLKELFKRIMVLIALVVCFYMGVEIKNGEEMGNYNDALITLEQAFRDAISISQARSYIQEHLPRLKNAAGNVLDEWEGEYASDSSEICNTLWSAVNKQNNIADIPCFADVLVLLENLIFGE